MEHFEKSIIPVIESVYSLVHSPGTDGSRFFYS